MDGPDISSIQLVQGGQAYKVTQDASAKVAKDGASRSIKLQWGSSPSSQIAGKLFLDGAEGQKQIKSFNPFKKQISVTIIKTDGTQARGTLEVSRFRFNARFGDFSLHRPSVGGQQVDPGLLKAEARVVAEVRVAEQGGRASFSLGGQTFCAEKDASGKMQIYQKGSGDSWVNLANPKDKTVVLQQVAANTVFEDGPGLEGAQLFRGDHGVAFIRHETFFATADQGRGAIKSMTAGLDATIQGLAHVHKQGKSYGNIGPSQIGITQDGACKLRISNTGVQAADSATQKGEMQALGKAWAEVLLGKGNVPEGDRAIADALAKQFGSHIVARVELLLKGEVPTKDSLQKAEMNRAMKSLKSVAKNRVELNLRRAMAIRNPAVYEANEQARISYQDSMKAIIDIMRNMDPKEVDSPQNSRHVAIAYGIMLANFPRAKAEASRLYGGSQPTASQQLELVKIYLASEVRTALGMDVSPESD